MALQTASPVQIPRALESYPSAADQSLASELASITESVHAGLTLHLITDAPTLLA